MSSTSPWRLALRALDRARFYANVPEVLTLLKFRKRRAAFYDGLWKLAAFNIGADYELMGNGFARISIDGVSTVTKGYEVMLDSALMLKLMGDKAVTYGLMREAGAGVVRHQIFTARDLAPAREFLKDLGRAAVVKPSAGTGAGRGVTTGIRSVAELQRAARYAARFGEELLIEEQIEGHSYRLLFLNGKFIDAVRREAPQLVGDGHNTIRQLVKAENYFRLNHDEATALSPLRFDLDMTETLAKQGLTLKTRPARGQWFTIKTVVNENAARENHLVRDLVHPTTIEQGRKLVGRLGIRFAGLDVICKDISQPLGALNGIFGEINTTPGLHHHELVANPEKRVRIAELVLEHIFSSRDGAMAFGPARIGALFRPPFLVRA